MKPSSFENAIRLQFDCLARKVVGTTVKDYNRELGRIAGIIYKAQDQYVSIALVLLLQKLFQKSFCGWYQIPLLAASVSAKRGRSLFALATLAGKEVRL